MGDLGRRSAFDGNRVEIRHAALVGGKENARLVGGERGAADRDGVHELLDGVLPGGAGNRWSAAKRDKQKQQYTA